MSCSYRHNSNVSEAVSEDVLLALKDDTCQSLHPHQVPVVLDGAADYKYLTSTLKGEKRLFNFKCFLLLIYKRTLLTKII